MTKKTILIIILTTLLSASAIIAALCIKGNSLNTEETTPAVLIIDKPDNTHISEDSDAVAPDSHTVSDFTGESDKPQTESSDSSESETESSDQSTEDNPPPISINNSAPVPEYEFIGLTNPECGYDCDKMLAAMYEQMDKTTEDLGFDTPWCALWLTAHLRENNVTVYGANPCAVVISALENGQGTYYNFREENYNSLVENELSEEGLKRVEQTTRDKVTPCRGDIIIYHWTDDTEYNWSHIGVATSYDEENNILHTCEGNVDEGVVGYRNRYYDANIAGILRF